jgi:hypothetical protein
MPRCKFTYAGTVADFNENDEYMLIYGEEMFNIAERLYATKKSQDAFLEEYGSALIRTKDGDYDDILVMRPYIPHLDADVYRVTGW